MMTQRDDLTQSLLAAVITAIEKGDKDAAIAAANKMWDETNSVRQITAEIGCSLLTYIAKEQGEEKIYDAWAYVANDVWKPRISSIAEMSYEQVVDAYASIMRGLGSGFKIEQDDEKAVVSINCCGSAGKLRQEGKFDNTDRCETNCGTMKKAQPWAFNKKGMSYYCVHAPIWFNLLPHEWGIAEDLIVYETWGKQFDDDGNPIDDPCKVVIRNPATLRKQKQPAE